MTIKHAPIGLTLETSTEKAAPRRGGQISFKHGIREIGGRAMYFHSAYEANFARYLQRLKGDHKISDWIKNTTKFPFSTAVVVRGVVMKSFIPDFLVIDLGGNSHYYEVKGWENDKFTAQLAQFNHDYSCVDLTVFGKEWFRQNLDTLKQLEGYEPIKV